MDENANGCQNVSFSSDPEDKWNTLPVVITDLGRTVPPSYSTWTYQGAQKIGWQDRSEVTAGNLSEIKHRRGILKKERLHHGCTSPPTSQVKVHILVCPDL